MHADRFLAGAPNIAIKQLSTVEIFATDGQTDAAFVEVELALNSLISCMALPYATVHPGAFNPPLSTFDGHTQCSA